MLQHPRLMSAEVEVIDNEIHAHVVPALNEEFEDSDVEALYDQIKYTLGKEHVPSNINVG
eukprot:CAMPEP_0117419766 /NCGR_PEP_ID=MMETSP0758-20121206/1251_1 /TAXON_ID=63605 /ORGANISM="Percolomonas cosmopolitus, Strain AE-1 (ATCC 50343)" /LENGTH=59 /DNA_ID=CAMNT_0005201005 /DNA_START=1352 /DNA_END=1527 /DNA_ORIENTATION=-